MGLLLYFSVSHFFVWLVLVAETMIKAEKVFPFFVPKGHRILAGGETTGTGGNGNPRPGRAPDQSFGPAPFQGWKSFGANISILNPQSSILDNFVSARHKIFHASPPNSLAHLIKSKIESGLPQAIL